KLDASLIDLLPESISEPLNQILMLSVERVYRSKNVLEIEIAGFNVVGELLDAFINAVNDYHTFGKNLKKERPYSDKLVRLFPKQFLIESDDHYLRTLRVCEFVAGMTDSYAVTLFRRIKGIELPL
ncbi:MAG: dGTP triphosphohydrolase, partial [Bacteroidota bacterium]